MTYSGIEPFKFGSTWSRAGELGRFICLGFALALAVTGLTNRALGQSQSINGTIRGRVTDPSGAAIPNATVTVVNVATGYKVEATSQANGYYVIPNLPLGNYTVSIARSGFATMSTPNVVLEAGTEAVINGQLKVGSISTTVQVTGGAPIVEPARTNIGRTITTREIQSLPLTSRNPYNFILFQPGISGHPNPELGIPRTVNTNGLMDRINYQMDGMTDTESDRYGLRLFPISDVYVREVQTVSNSYAPEFGGTTGDIYNVITNSGTNDWHGMGFFMKRSVDATARPILLPANQNKPDLQLDDVAGNIGGPVRKDKLFVFGAYEHLKRGQPSPNVISPANAALLGLNSNLLATAPSLEHAQFLDTRIDYNINSKNRIFLRYNYFRNEFPFNTAVGGVNALDAASDFHDRAHIIGAQIVSTISPSVLNEFRFSWPYRKEKHVADPLTGPGPQILIPGVAAFNGSIATGDFFAERSPSFNDNVTMIHGAHTFKFGGAFQSILDVQQGDTYTQYIFPSIAAYLSAKSGANPFAYTTVKASVGNTRAEYQSTFWDLYGQDCWQLRPSLLMTYGLRYDRFQSPPANPNAPFVFSRSFRNPAANLQPRLGLAWSLGTKTVIRADAGIFYDAPPTNLWFNSFSNDGSGLAYIASLASNSAFAPPFPQPISVSSSPPFPDVTTVTPGFRNAYTVNTSLQVTHQLGTNDSMTVGYVFTGGRELQFLRNMNLINPTATLADGRPVFSSTISAATRLYPEFNNITLQDVGANSNYNALLVTYQHRFSNWYQMSASYTYSHALTDAPEVNTFEQNLPIEDPTNRQRDYGNSSVNRPQAFTVSSVLQPRIEFSSRVANVIANGNEFAFLVNASSGDEQNIVSSKVLNGDQTAASVTRPLYIGRNTVETPNIFQLDLRFTRTVFRVKDRVALQFMMEINNLLNNRNVTFLNMTVPVTSTGLGILPSTFTPLSTVLEGRIVQFGAQLRF